MSNIQDNQEKYCKGCAYDGKKECVAMEQRCQPCWARCSTIDDLDKRYDAMELYCKNSPSALTKIREQYKSCLSRLRRCKTV